MAGKTFKRGGHIPHYKELTKDKAIARLELPRQVIIPLQQHIGAPCEPLVVEGEQVRAGQKIGAASVFVSAPVHASVTGRVVAIGPYPHCSGTKVQSIVIERTSDEQVQPGTDKALDDVAGADIIASIDEAGIVGMGGAGFPTKVKLSPNKPVDTVIINGAECEPYLTADHRYMLESAEDVVLGLRAAMKAVGAIRGYIGIEDNKPDCILAMEKAVTAWPNIEVVPLRTKYPQGGEKQLIFAITGKMVPSGGLPMDVGVVVQNVGTAVAIAHAVTKALPLVERVVTVSGPEVPRPGNYLIPIGTPLAHVLAQCGITDVAGSKVIVGGPMTGIAQTDLDAPVIKTSSGVLVFPPAMVKQQTLFHDCVRCARCVDQCPMFLYPNEISRYAEVKRYGELAKWNILDCIECGLCSYSCPAHRPIVQMIKDAKPVVMENIRKAQ